MEELLIDGCNLAYLAFGGASERDRDLLVRALVVRYQTKQIRVTVVFDSREGGDRQEILPHVVVRYAQAPADDHLVRRVEDSKNPRSITVITDDRGVISRVRGYGARHVGCREFIERSLGRLGSSGRSESPGRNGSPGKKGSPGQGKARRGIPHSEPHADGRPEKKPSSESRAGVERYLKLWDRPGAKLKR